MNFKALLEKIMEKRDLTSAEAGAMMRSVMEGKLTDTQAAAFLIALRGKGVTSDELLSFVKTLRKYSERVRINSRNIIDTCGTGGDQSHTFNISTVSAFVVAASGILVAKHGNKSVSSKCGSADVLSELGVRIDLEPEQTKRCIEKAGIGFFFAQKYHPAFRNVGHIRKELGVRTVFNMLGPLLNPANVTGQVIGVYDQGLTGLYAATLNRMGMKRAMVVHGSGLDELTLTGMNRISEIRDGKIKTYDMKPRDAGLKQCTISELKGGSVKRNAEIFLSILDGKKSPKRDIVLLNSAAALIVGGKARDFREGVALAGSLIDSGRAREVFERFREMTNDTG